MDEQQLRLLRSLQELDYLRESHFFVVNVEVKSSCGKYNEDPVFSGFCCN